MIIEPWILFGLFFLFLGAGNGDRSIFEPNPQVVSAKCLDLSDLEEVEKRYVVQGKASGYSVAGETICRSNIFKYGERRSYVDFVTGHTSGRADETAQKLLALHGAYQSNLIVLPGKPGKPENEKDRNLASLVNVEPSQSRSTAPYFVDVSGIRDVDLAVYVRSVFTQSLVESLGRGAVIRQADNYIPDGNDQRIRILKVSLRKVVDPQILFDIEVSNAVVSGGEMALRWRFL